MFFLSVIEFAIAIVVVWVFLSEILVPLVDRQPIFPSFRKIGKLESEAREANEKVEEARLEVEVRKTKERAERISRKVG